jgi:hypothetical protein
MSMLLLSIVSCDVATECCQRPPQQAPRPHSCAGMSWPVVRARRGWERCRSRLAETRPCCVAPLRFRLAVACLWRALTGPAPAPASRGRGCARAAWPPSPPCLRRPLALAWPPRPRSGAPPPPQPAASSQHPARRASRCRGQHAASAGYHLATIHQAGAVRLRAVPARGCAWPAVGCCRAAGPQAAGGARACADRAPGGRRTNKAACSWWWIGAPARLRGTVRGTPWHVDGEFKCLHVRLAACPHGAYIRCCLGSPFCFHRLQHTGSDTPHGR